MLTEYQEENQPEISVLPGGRKWSPLPTDVRKINTGAAYLGNSYWGLGVVCRDSNGALWKASAKRVEVVNDPAVVECLTLRWALELAESWGIRKIILETDCRRAVDEFKNPDPSSPLFGLLIDVFDLASTL